MDTLDDMKEKWAAQHENRPPYDSSNTSRVIRRRAHQHMREPMKYFWASLVFQILLYALYAHVIVRYFHDPFAVSFAFAGILLYVPFTHMLLREFKRMALLRPEGRETPTVQQYITNERNMLQSFFRFKMRYELFLIPLSSLIGTLLVFRLFVPGGPLANPNGVWITMALTVVSCYVAIRIENRKRFVEPMNELDKLIVEFKDEDTN